MAKQGNIHLALTADHGRYDMYHCIAGQGECNYQYMPTIATDITVQWLQRTTTRQCTITYFRGSMPLTGSDKYDILLNDIV